MSNEINISDPTIEIPNDNGVEGLNEDAMGGTRTPPQPGNYQLLASYSEDKPSDKLFKRGTNADPEANILSTMVNFTIIGADKPTEPEPKWLGAKIFNQYLSTKINEGQDTSILTDCLISAGIPKEERKLIKLPGGLTKARDLFLQVVAQELPVWAYCQYEWQGKSMRSNPNDPEKQIFVSRGKDFPKVPNGMKSTPESPYSKNEEGLYPTEREYTHVWEDGEEEVITLQARLKIVRFILPPKN